MNNKPILLPKVLLVDDISINRSTTKALLKNLSMDLDEAENGEQAIELTSEKNYALILLDVNMPGMSGFDVAETLRSSKRTQHIPIIFMTALNKCDKFVFKGYKSGAVDYLIKPFNPHILKSKVNVFLTLEKNRLEQDLIKDSLHKEFQRAEEKSQEFQAFANRVAHDLKGPLGLISSFSEMLTTDELNPEEKTQLLERITSISKLAYNTIDGIYSLAELNSQMSMIKHSVNVQKKIEGILIGFHNDFENNDIQYEVICPDPINISIKQLSILITNLVSNALKFKSESRVQKLRIYTTPSQEFTHLCVEDNGPGIPPEKRQKIFFAMERLVGDHVPGLGLGLSMVKRVMELHKGSVIAEDAKYLKGTCFTLSFPNDLKN